MLGVYELHRVELLRDVFVWTYERSAAKYAAQRQSIDEIQRLPELLNEVHDLIESQKRIFFLTGSSARKLRRKGGNLPAGRALTYYLHPLTVKEQEEAFYIE